ncbi:MAG: ribosome assembly RNA-binding protein YhbY [Lachnospiraceae bacterium]|nr:ribosome assembly RNA-binding protein YhbY [Lachnospiraceae bacterium]
MTSKQRAYLKGLAMVMDPVVYIGKSSLTPENTKNVEEALAARELVKIGVLNNCLDEPRAIAGTLAEHTRSEVVQVIGKKIVLYRPGKDKNRKIELPKAKKS